MHRAIESSAVSALWRHKPVREKAMAIAIVAGFAVQWLLDLVEVTRQILSQPALRDALAMSLGAGLATGLGALGALSLRRGSTRTLALTMAVAAGAMSTAALLTLLVPAWQSGESTPISLAAAFMLGAGLMYALDLALPHQHPAAPPADAQQAEGKSVARASWLLVAAISLHNLPEGLAVGVSASSGGGAATALAIAIQNLPEGLVIAAVLLGVGLSRGAAVAVATLSGLVEPFGAIIGIAGVGALPEATRLAMAAAAGAMLFVVAHELLPAARRSLAGRSAGVAFAGGFATMAIAGGIFQ